MPYGPRSARTSPLPKDWPQRRARVLARDSYACRWLISYDGTRCGRHATDVDHIGDPNNHDDDNLQSLCPGHHRVKSSRQGGKAAAVKRPRRNRPPEPHPGVIG